MASVASPGSVPYDPAMSGSPPGARGTILIAEDEDGVRDSLTQVLREEGYDVVSTADGNEAIAALGTREFDVVVSDVRMPGADGLTVLRQAREIAPQTLVLLMTAHATVETAVAALRGGAQDYLLKPVMFDELLHKIEALIEHRQLAWERQFLRSQVDRQWDFENLVGRSSAMREVMSAHQARRPGAEHGADHRRERHRQGGRRARHPRLSATAARRQRSSPSTAAPSPSTCSRASSSATCAAPSPAPIATSTGSSSARPRRHALPRRDRRAAASTCRSSCCASSRSAKFDAGRRQHAGHGRRPHHRRHQPRPASDEVEAGRFRDDLYYRLNVIRIELPPLRERREDIPPLVDHFVRLHNRELKKRFKGADAALLKVFMSLPWKGNVRELDNVIEHTMILGDGDWITINDLPRALRVDAELPLPASDNLREALRAYEKAHIESILGQARPRQARRRRAPRHVAVVAVPQDRGARHRFGRRPGISRMKRLRPSLVCTNRSARRAPPSTELDDEGAVVRLVVRDLSASPYADLTGTRMLPNRKPTSPSGGLPLADARSPMRWNVFRARHAPMSPRLSRLRRSEGAATMSSSSSKAPPPHKRQKGRGRIPMVLQGFRRSIHPTAIVGDIPTSRGLQYRR